MGTWGTEPWQNDDALDWFYQMFSDLPIDRIRDAFKYYDSYGRIRGACYVLQQLGPHLWPTSHQTELLELLDMGIEWLNKVLNPPDSSWDYLELWGHDQEVLDSLQEQLEALTEIRKLKRP